MPHCPDCWSSTLSSIYLWMAPVSFELFLTTYVPNCYDRKAVAAWEMASDRVKEIIAKDHSYIKRVLYPDIRALLMPYTANRFAHSMRQRLLPNGVDWHIEEIEILFDHKFGNESAPFTFFKRPVPPYVSDVREFFKRSVVSEILQFLKTYKEGAFVVIELRES